MGLTVYIDESGTNDNSEFTLLVGYVAKDDIWGKFIKDWDSILKKYKVGYFHFCEWATAARIKNKPEAHVDSSYKTNPYRNLEIVELNNFFDECAKMLGEPDIYPIPAILDNKTFQQDKLSGKITNPIALLHLDDPYSLLFKKFFYDTFLTIFKRWGKTDDELLFVFDNVEEIEWRNRIEKIAYQHRPCERPIKEIKYLKKTEALPLQACDMLAYRTNQVCNNVRNEKFAKKMTLLDSIVMSRIIVPKGWKRRF